MSIETSNNCIVNCFVISTEYTDHDKSFLEHGIFHKETIKEKRRVSDKRIRNLQIIDCICDGVPVKWYAVLLNNKPSRVEMTHTLQQLSAIVIQDYEDRIADIKMINKAISLKEKFFFSMMRMSGKGFGKISQNKEKYILYMQIV